MHNATRVALVIGLAIIALLLLRFGGGMVSETMMSGGMMDSESMGGYNWIWIFALFAVLPGVFLVTGFFGKK